MRRSGGYDVRPDEVSPSPAAAAAPRLRRRFEIAKPHSIDPAAYLRATFLAADRGEVGDDVPDESGHSGLLPARMFSMAERLRSNHTAFQIPPCDACSRSDIARTRWH